MDQETEVYSSSGWVKFSELTKEDQLLTLNPDSFDLEWLRPTRLISQHNKGKMIHIKNQQLDILTTPDHQMFYKKRWDQRCGRDKWQFCRAEELPPDALLYRSSRWTGEDRPTTKVGTLELPTEHFCQFVALFLTEGSVDKRGNRIKIAQYRETSKAQMLAALKKLPVRVAEFAEGIHVTSDDLHTYASQFGPCYEKFVPEEIKSLSPKYISVFLEYFRLGDGGFCEGKDDWNGYKLRGINVYRTTSKRMADDVGELIMKVGKRPSFRLQPTKGVAVKFRNGTYTMNHDLWHVYECHNLQASLQEFADRVSSVHYDNPVYCVELPRNHTLYIRRNGKCVWVGNYRTTVVAA